MYDQKKDFLVAFSPLIYDGIPTDTCVPIEQVQATVEQKRGLKFPLHIIKTVLTRGKRDGYVTDHEQKNLFCLSDKGIALVGEIENARDVERRINALGADLVHFFSQKKVVKTEQEIAVILQKFLDVNLSYLVDLFGDGEAVADISLSKIDEQLLLSYIKETSILSL